MQHYAQRTGEAAASGTAAETEDVDIDEMDEETKQARLLEARNRVLLRDDFAMHLSKFRKSITRTMQQLEGEVRLEMPQLNVNAENVNEQVGTQFIREGAYLMFWIFVFGRRFSINNKRGSL